MNQFFSVEFSSLQWILLALIGTLVGIINTLAGSGSLITLPIFEIFFGLSPTLANGTNRIGALLQSALGALAFRKSNPKIFENSAMIMGPCIVGAVFGALAATQATDRQMELVIAGLMVFMLVVLVVNPNRWLRESSPDNATNRRWQNVLTFLGIGFYGGYIQAGVGIFLLAGLVLAAKYSLKDANAIKLAVVTCLSVPSLIIFAYSGQIHYALGLLMASFQMAGAVIGVWISQRMANANIWIHRLLILMLAVFALKLFGLLDWIWPDGVVGER